MSVTDKSGVDFKQVSIGPVSVEIPNDWDLVSLEDVAENSGEYGANASAQPFDLGEFRYIRITDLTEDGRLKNNDKQSIPIEGNEKYELENGDLLFARTGAVGRTYLYSESDSEVPCAFAGYLIRYKLSDKIDQEYLRQYTDSEYFNKWVNSVARSTTHANINASEYSSVDIPYPPLAEQRRIADILSTVDEQIQQTDEIIESTEELRIGLMNEFFHTGYNQHSTTTKGTLGETPTDWDVCPLSDVADVEMGSSPKSEYYNTTGEGLPFFQANNEFGYRLPTHDRWCSEPKKIAEEGDTLVTIRGTYVGQVNVAPERCCIGRGLAAVSATDVDQEYLYHQLAHREKYVKSIASGSTFDSINSTELRSLSVQVPPRDEQKKIASCLRTLQHRYAEEIEYKETLQELKRGLMQDLLTGKVRVNTD